MPFYILWCIIFKPGTHACFLEIVFVGMLVCVCVCVCVSATEGTSNQWHKWCDIGCVWLVKPILQLFSLLPSINCMGVALVMQCIMYTWKIYQSWHAIHRRKHINYLVVATRGSALVINLSGRMQCDEFKRKQDFSFTVIILA